MRWSSRKNRAIFEKNAKNFEFKILNSDFLRIFALPFGKNKLLKTNEQMKVCEITGKVAIVGNNVSHSHHKTKRKFSPNLKTKRFWSEEEGRWITLKVSAAGMKTINKKGLAVAMREAVAPKKIY